MPRFERHIPKLNLSNGPLTKFKLIHRGQLLIKLEGEGVGLVGLTIAQCAPRRNLIPLLGFAKHPVLSQLPLGLPDEDREKGITIRSLAQTNQVHAICDGIAEGRIKLDISSVLPRSDRVLKSDIRRER